MKRFAVVAATLAVAGCSIHPLPEDVTGLNTHQIVRQIRCEARAALTDMITEVLEKSKDLEVRAIGRQYKDKPDSIAGFSYTAFSAPRLVQYRETFKLFYDAGLAMNFDLDMSEQNNLDTGLGFAQTFAHASLTLGFVADAHRTRQNDRIFTVTDTFSGILKIPPKYCTPQYIAGENFKYPLAGHIGIIKTLKDFVDLTLFDSLANKDDVKGPPTMTDTLTFTTTLTGSVNPVVLFTPVTNAFHVANVSATGEAIRSDVHKVTIGLAIAAASVKDVSTVRSALLSPSRAIVVGHRVTGGGTPNEQLAVWAIDQVKSRELQLLPPTP
jgi:hypothetical protein